MAKLGMRYTTFISDGDSKAYDTVKSLKLYGDIKIVKEGCINHVGKRLGTRLRKLKAEYRGTKTQKRSSLGGKHKLTDDVIEALQRYYTGAIYRNVGGTVEKLRDDILASYFHCISTDARPLHHKCPTRKENNYCFYNRALAMNMTPQSHEKMLVYFRLEKEERNQVFQVYKDLAKDELLQRCLKGKTQNANESLRSKIWGTLSKTKFYGLKTVQYSVVNTVLKHNFGYEAASVSAELGFGKPPHHVAEMKKKDKKRRISAIPKRKAKRKKGGTSKQDEDNAAGAF